MNLDKFRVTSSNFALKDHTTNDTGTYEHKKQAKKDMAQNIEKMRILQNKLYAQNEYALLIIIQAMDAAGKDGLIKHVMSGINPQGCQVVSFKQPSSEELDHDFLWRINKKLPERGRIGIFNRSHYEDVIIVRVHDLVQSSQIPEHLIGQDIWSQRFEHIRNFEQYLFDNAIIPIKIFLNLSKDEQRERFYNRIDDPAKNWKFSAGDVRERQHWQDYMNAFEDAIKNTACQEAPWYVIPADKKWYARLVASEIIVETMEKLNLTYPKLSEAEVAKLSLYKQQLMKEEN